MPVMSAVFTVRSSPDKDTVPGMIVPVILAGGAGTGLWPYSRALHPKPLLPLVGDRTLLERALDLALAVNAGSDSPPIVVAHEDHRFLVAEAVRDRGARLLIEPERRNTAMAIATVAAGLDPADVLVVLPADLIVDLEPFRDAIAVAVDEALAGSIAILAIPPRRASTAVGYAHLGEPSGHGGRVVRRFIEKPDAAHAEACVAAGDLWNAGIVVATAWSILSDLSSTFPEIAVCATNAAIGALADLDFVRLPASAYVQAPSLSFERAVLERSPRVVAVPIDARWADVGDWSALCELNPADDDGNVSRGDVVTLDAKRTYVHASERLVVALGVEDLIVVETADAVLVAAKSAVHRVADAVAALGDRSEASVHPRVARPWGAFEAIDRGPRFQVKRITVRPGASLSLQRHRRRAEHWVVVRGQARVTRGDTVLELSVDQSMYIPAGVAHRLENPGTDPLEIIEVQTGDYLGEDDIERLDDRYGRK